MAGTLIRLQAGIALVDGPLPEGAFKPARAPVAPPDLAKINAGQGDARPLIVPKVAWPTAHAVTRWERGALPGLAEWLHTGGPAVALMATDDPMQLAGRLEGVKLIAIEFARATDGRGLSLAQLIRERLGWRGELRAVGEVLADQLVHMARCGFSSFALRSDQDGELCRSLLQRPVPIYRFAGGAGLGAHHANDLDRAAS